MANKRKTKRRNNIQYVPAQPKPIEPKPVEPEGWNQGNKLTPPEQQDVVKRLSKVIGILSAPPESIIALLDRLEIHWTRTNLPLFEQGEQDCMVIKWSDLMEGEERNREQGSIMKRFYGKPDFQVS
jgi:hypothetical protein